MKTNIMLTMTVGALALGGIAHAQSKNIVDTAIDSGQFPTLVRLVTEADLAQTLRGSGPFTVFAPTEEAFAHLPDRTLNMLMQDKEMLKAVLLYHVVPGRYTASQVMQSGRMNAVPTALDGASVDIRAIGKRVKIGNSTVVGKEMRASNGVIHSIDRVLIPNARFMRNAQSTRATQVRGYASAEGASIVTVATNSGRFPTLVKLIQEAGLVDLLNGEGPFTVFAPSEAAFAAVPDRTLNMLMQDKEMLKSVLLYHVVPGKVMADQVMTMHGHACPTVMSDKTLRIRIDGDRAYVGDARIIQTNIQASNGVIHVIDKVLMP